MNEVINKMYERKKQPYPETIAQKFVNYSEHYDTIVIVEGISDEDFYKNTNIAILNNAFYIYAKKNKYDSNNKNIPVGKEAVIKAYFEIRDYSWRKKFNNSLIFIIDKDFFGIDWSAPKYRKIANDTKAKKEDIDNFTILDCHSHECYFILENNLKKIFKILNIEDKMESFNSILEDNLEDFSEYFAFKSILEDENPKLSYVGYKYDNISNIRGINFNFEFNNENIIFNKEEMKKTIEIMKRTIQDSSNKINLENQYLEMKQKFKIHPELLRGHTLFELLECYLNHYGKGLKDYQQYNKEIIREMDIPLDIKILKFEIGKYKLDIE